MRPTLRSTRSDRRLTRSKDGKENTEGQGSYHQRETGRGPVETRRSTSGKKARHRMSTAQLIRLEEVFQEGTHPSRQRKKDVATELGMDYKTVTIWFQNKRQTAKRSQPPVTVDGLDFPVSPKQALTQGQPRADSSLREVSSPSNNTTLETPERNSKARHPQSRGDSVNIVTSKAFIKIKPLLRSLNALTSKPKQPSEDKDAKDEEENIKHDEPHPLSPVSSGVPATLTDTRQEQIVEADHYKDRGIQWKRVRTLEWACERQAKRHKSSKDDEYTKLGSDTDEVQESATNDLRTDSALSLLSLASSTHQGAQKDVMRGASLLLSLKHSWGGQ
ncbi:homeobox-domain-containing protein [Paxillus ammoniavirescens]|nr:homeobox-domain-containing protein [Paxillus ammoniavirescens]